MIQGSENIDVPKPLENQGFLNIGERVRVPDEGHPDFESGCF